MMLQPFLYKKRAKDALKGNWQTAMVVAFFSGILLTVAEVYQALAIPIYLYVDGQELYFAMGQVSTATWLTYGGLMLLGFLVTPVLDVGCDHYFVQRMKGTELNAAGLWSRLGIFSKALWLYLCIAVRVLLWSLLLIVPGILAALRYSLAPYYLAEHPEMTASEAIEASKAAMKDQKGSLFALLMSFLLWVLLSNFVQLGLESVSGILATVAGLFIRVWVSAYTNGAVASFYVTVSDPERLERARTEMRGMMKAVGMDPGVWDRQKQENDKNGEKKPFDGTAPEREPAGEGKDDGGDEE